MFGSITLRWSGWRDDDSGIGEYEYEVFKLRPFGDMLGMRGLSPVPGQTGTVGAAATQASIRLTEPGVYSIVLTVEDGCGPNDGNFVITRRFLIYDDNSTVQADTSGHHPMWAESASNVTGRVWQTNLQDALGNGPQVAVSWPDHFCNQLHKHNKFLNAIEEHPSPILPGYEELIGQPPATRSREAIPNVNTILLFQTDWAVDHQGGRSLSSPPGNWQNVTDMTVKLESHFKRVRCIINPESNEISQLLTCSDVHLAQNERWPLPDQEFTPARDKLSAVWPTLRHGHYRWKVVSDESIQNWAYVASRHALRYSDYDCSAPQVLACGETEENFVNVPGIELLHGRRYHICVHANATVLHFELFDQSLDEVDSCSIGITVDLTPPLPGQVWVNHKDGQFQTSTSEMTVYWNTFRDVEEHGMSSHHSVVHKYEVAVGTSPNGVDVQDFMDVGVTNMATVHGLRLFSGHTYYATVR
ncbi:PREDICTED: uncharacterized protein LOC109465081, partial [Branchiostoma belcheri]|uniref:Uncharacterized protein LOC109465081 n=1 Tax=Branchiostoma belcheri TaxID=7741 RepID=A0A6P4YG82_BRABE